MKVKTIEKDGVKITIYRQYMIILESPTQNRTIKGIGTLSEAEQTAVEIMEDYDKLWRIMTEKLDKIYSQYIRLKDADSNGYIKCYCCGESVFWKEAQNMHFMGRRHTNTRYLDLNCHAGCFECNVTKSGNLKAYQEHLIRDHGEEVVYTLKTMANTYMKYSKTELEGLIKHYKKEVKRLKKEKGL